MNDSPNPQIAAETAREAKRNAAALFENFMLCAPVTKAMRALAEQHVVETRKTYQRSKTALETSMATVERSFDAMGKGATALNRKVMDIAQRNIDTGFDLARSPGWSPGPRRDGRIAGSLLAQAVRRPQRSGRGGALALGAGQRRCGQTGPEPTGAHTEELRKAS